MPIPNALVATTAVTSPRRGEAAANIFAVCERLVAFMPLLVNVSRFLKPFLRSTSTNSFAFMRSRFLNASAS
jgi:hypothetical protein